MNQLFLITNIFALSLFFESKNLTSNSSIGRKIEQIAERKELRSSTHRRIHGGLHTGHAFQHGPRHIHHYGGHHHSHGDRHGEIYWNNDFDWGTGRHFGYWGGSQLDGSPGYTFNPFYHFDPRFYTYKEAEYEPEEVIYYYNVPGTSTYYYIPSE